MSNSSLVTYTKKSPNYTKLSGKKNTHIVIHHMAGKLTVQQCGQIFANPARQASSNYGVQDKNVGLYVDESNRSWATSNREIDSKAVTIETSNSTLGPDWKVSEESINTLIKLCADICKRNGIKELKYTGDKSGNLHLHQWYSATGCPGPYLKSKMKYIAAQVNNKLKKPATVSKTKYKVIEEGGMNVRESYNTSSKIKGLAEYGKTYVATKSHTNTDGTLWVYFSGKKGWVCYKGKKKTYLKKMN